MAILELVKQDPLLHFVEEDHRYYYWSQSHQQWVSPLSVSSVWETSGAEVMNFASWRNSLKRTYDFTTEEADAYIEEFCDHRAQVGTDFHLLAQYTLLNEALPRTNIEDEAVMMWEVWKREFLPHIGRVRLIETPMIHKGLYYTGTPDLVAQVFGRETLVDWKSKQSREKARVRDVWLPGQGAYWELLSSNYGIEVEWGMNYMVWSTGQKLQQWNAADLLKGRAEFLRLLYQHHHVLALQGDPWHAYAKEVMRQHYPPQLLSVR